MPTPPERTALYRLYEAKQSQGIPPYLQELYPKRMSARHYLGMAKNDCRRLEGPGYYYTPSDWESDCVVAFGLRVDFPSRPGLTQQCYEDPENALSCHPAPASQYVYRRSAENPNHWLYVRLKTPEEMAVEEAPKRTRKTGATKRGDCRTAVYRLRDAADRLLYVGISDDPLRRWPEHAKDKPWWQDVANFSIEWFGSRPEAFAAEALAIKSERPLHNIVHNADLRPAA